MKISSDPGLRPKISAQLPARRRPAALHTAETAGADAAPRWLSPSSSARGTAPFQAASAPAERSRLSPNSPVSFSTWTMITR